MRPTQIVWSEEFAVGDEDLDREHQQIVELINMVYLAGSLPLEHREVGPLLDGLLKTVRQHFNHENSILSRINRGQIQPGIDKASFINAMITAAVDEHVANHVSSLRELNTIIRKIRIELAADAASLGAELKDWFIGHATAHDAHLRPIFEALKRPIA